tara:strand:+ start:1849 stop:2013 length:165 start_codon:yes stop_codon:yes gene_type:complete
MINWIIERAKEPSSYAAVGVGIVGLGVISGAGGLVFIGIASGILGIVIKEKTQE